MPSSTPRRATWRASLAAAAILATAAIGPFGPGRATASPPTDGADARPWVSGDHTVPVFDLDATIYEEINIETGMDGDEDGVVDTIRIELARPDAGPDAKVPLIVHASPYYFRSGRNAWESSFFVPYGYAVATVALPGTDFSTGCSDVGADLEVLGTKAVVDWANGRAKGFYLDGTRARATWATGQVGMIGVSWDGTIANAVAATGVEGLETIVPVAAISSWYDYTRGNGVAYYDDHVTTLHEYVSNFESEFCRGLTPVLQAESDDATSSYNDWWSERDYRIDAENITASVFVVHGLEDENVRTGQFGSWWDELVEHDVERKLFLHQKGHVDPYYSFGPAYVNPLLEWFDYYLQDLDNGVPEGPQAIIQREDEFWTQEEVWPPADTAPTKMKLSKPLARGVGGLSVDRVATAQAKTAKIVQSTERSLDDVVANPTTPRADRAVFLSSSLDDALRQSGTARVHLRVKVDAPVAGFQARVVDYASSGSAWVVSRTMASLNHRAGLDQYTTLQPGKFYNLTWNVHTDDRIFAAGHRLGLVLTAERQNIEGSYQPVTATIQLKKSWIEVPLTGAGTAPAGLDAVAPTVGTSVGNARAAQTLEEFTREFLVGAR